MTATTQPKVTKKKPLRGLLRSRPFLAFAVVALVWIVASLTMRGFGAYGHLQAGHGRQRSDRTTGPWCPVAN